MDKKISDENIGSSTMSAFTKQNEIKFINDNLYLPLLFELCDNKTVQYPMDLENFIKFNDCFNLYTYDNNQLIDNMELLNKQTLSSDIKDSINILFKSEEDRVIMEVDDKKLSTKLISIFVSILMLLLVILPLLWHFI